MIKGTCADLYAYQNPPEPRGMWRTSDGVDEWIAAGNKVLEHAEAIIQQRISAGIPIDNQFFNMLLTMEERRNALDEKVKGN